jgi:FtsP/CotA-like multicopper oxidase with cupredoxin domain
LRHRRKLNLNAQPYGDSSAVPEMLKWNSVEDWYFVNTTPDTHPMQTHLFTFKVMGRYNYNAKGYVAAHGGPNGVPQLDVSTLTPFLKSGLIAPPPEEAGSRRR